MTKRYIFSMSRRPRKKQLYHFTGSGLPNVYLASGFTVENDPEYGELVTIEKLPVLFMAIAFRLTTMKDKLSGLEFRFLRKRMELSQPELAKLLQVNEQTVANYEKGRTDAGAADTAMRFLFLAYISDDDDVAQELRLEAEDLMKPSRRLANSEPPKAGPWVFTNGV